MTTTKRLGWLYGLLPWRFVAGVALQVLALSSRAADIDPALVEVRRAKSDPALNMLTYRHFDEMFNSRTVASASTTWQMRSSSLRLDDTVAYIADGGNRVDLPTYLQRSRVNALLVLRDGKIVRETYRNGSNPDSRFVGFSMSKSIISMLIGVAIEEGHITGIDDPITRYLPELEGTAYTDVTLRQMLRMRSGTSWREDYAPGSELANIRDKSVNDEKVYYESYSSRLKRATAPGTVFNYSSLDTELMGRVLAQATGQDVAHYMSDKLWKPAGMEAPGYWVLQGPSGHQHEWYSAGFCARLRDYGRLGQLMLDKGRALGRQVIPSEWVEQSTHPDAGDTRYFYFWWGLRDMDGFEAIGVQGQHILIDRPSRTVMVVMSYQDPAAHETGDTERMFRAIVSALSVAPKQ